jgi:hypothetical protein
LLGSVIGLLRLLSGALRQDHLPHQARDQALNRRLLFAL